MQKRKWKRIAITAGSVLVLGIVVLAFHIWWVMRPRVDATTRIMARIDIHQPILPADASRITAWLYQQKGVDHVLVNPKVDIAVFTYSPLQNNANTITQQFRQELAYSSAARVIPSEREMAMGCPVAASSFAYKAYKFISHLF
jgi:hypothetical protein